MQEKQVLERAFAMPLTSPAYPPGPYRFVNREYLIITYRTDPARLRAVVPEPLELDQREALVKYEFIRMPDSNGFCDYTASSGVFRRNWRNRRCEPRSMRWSERWITGRFASRPVRWDTSTVKPIWHR